MAKKPEQKKPEVQVRKRVPWAGRKIQSYCQGKSSTWLERRMIELANPVSLIAHIIALITFIFGLWKHNYFVIVIAVVLVILGHLYTRFS